MRVVRKNTSRELRIPVWISGGGLGCIVIILAELGSKEFRAKITI